MSGCSDAASPGSQNDAGATRISAADAAVPALHDGATDAMTGKSTADAGGEASAQTDVGEQAGHGGTAGSAGVPAPEDQGELQHCTFDAGCLEFRKHPSNCWTSNAINCQNIFQGAYDVGACPQENYREMHPNQTSCGLTVDFRK